MREKSLLKGFKGPFERIIILVVLKDHMSAYTALFNQIANEEKHKYMCA